MFVIVFGACQLDLQVEVFEEGSPWWSFQLQKGGNQAPVFPGPVHPWLLMCLLFHQLLSLLEEDRVS